MRLISLNKAELHFCKRIADEREHYALGYALEQGWSPRSSGRYIDFGTPEGDTLIAKDTEIHEMGAAGEVAFCKLFDIYYPNRMRRGAYSYRTDNVEWTGDPKEADVENDIEIRTIGPKLGFVTVKENDNTSFNVVGLRKLNDNNSLFRILGYHPVAEAQRRQD